MSFKDQAELFAQSLEYGFRTVAEVIAWADKNIAQLEMPPHWLLELSLMGQAKGQDVLHVLRHVEGVADDQKVNQGIFSLLLEQMNSNRMTGNRVVHFLLSRNRNMEFSFSEAVCQELDRFHAAYEDWFEVSNKSDLDRKLIAFLERQSRPFLIPESSRLFP